MSAKKSSTVVRIVPSKVPATTTTTNSSIAASALKNKVFYGTISFIPGGYSTRGQVLRGTTVTRKRARIEDDIVKIEPAPKDARDGSPSPKVLITHQTSVLPPTPALFKVPIAPAKKVSTFGRQQMILQAYKETLAVTSKGYTPAIRNTQDGTFGNNTACNSGNWMFHRMALFVNDVEKFKVGVCQLLDPSQLSVPLKTGSWLEALILRSCWYSQKRVQDSGEPFTNYRNPVYFDPECNYQIALLPSGDTPNNANLLDRMIDFMHALASLQMDETELSLVTAYLLFEDTSLFNFDFPERSEGNDHEGYGYGKAAQFPSSCAVQQPMNLRKAVHELLYEYQTKAIKNRCIAAPDGGSVPMSVTFRTMNVLMTIAQLSAISFLMGI